MQKKNVIECRRPLQNVGDEHACFAAQSLPDDQSGEMDLHGHRLDPCATIHKAARATALKKAALRRMRTQGESRQERLAAPKNKTPFCRTPAFREKNESRSHRNSCRRARRRTGDERGREDEIRMTGQNEDSATPARRISGRGSRKSRT